MFRLPIAIAILSLSPASLLAQTPTTEQLAFFENKIRPVLVDKCYSCHSSETKKPKADLLLDTRAGMRTGGESGPAIIPGDPKKSLLILALKHVDKSLRMPPKEKLLDEVIADFENWVRQGAADPREGEVKVARTEIDFEKARSFWAFQRPKRQAAPAVKDAGWPRSEVDRFLLADLEKQGLKPVGDAEPRMLLRRVYFDLIGLPPSPEQVETFAADPSELHFAKIVDELLASPRFGERWGRHWLDVARYGETSGRQINFNYPFAWRYRDYVIAAFNEDKPFDHFIREQMAGDLLPASDPKRRAEQDIATGFLAIGPKPHAERNLLQFKMDVIDEQIDVFSQAFLGLSAACARCHDHRFDPIPQRDYYALAGIFRSTETFYGTIRVIQCLHPAPLLEYGPESGLPFGLAPLGEAEKTTTEAKVKEIRDRREQQAKAGLPGTGADFNQLALFEHKLARFEKDGTPRRFAMGLREASTPVDSPLFVRGEVERPGAPVPRGLLQILDEGAASIPADKSGRLELANWLASPENPLTGRVFVNRVWGHLFGKGIVATPDNFGTSGQAPSHQPLLDALAVEFVEDGWSIKRLLRRLVSTRAYRLSGRHDEANFRIDPDNVYVWRMSPRRLEAEALRDAMLAVSGELELTPRAGSIVCQSGEGPSTTLMRQLVQLDSRDFHRAVYLPILREGVLDSLALFDFPDPQQVVGERVATNVPAQGLYLLNSPFVQARGEAAGDRLLKETKHAGERIERAYLRILGRPATAKERQAAERFLSVYPSELETSKVPAAQREKATWGALCQGLMASADFLYRP